MIRKQEGLRRNMEVSILRRIKWFKMKVQSEMLNLREENSHSKLMQLMILLKTAMIQNLRLNSLEQRTLKQTLKLIRILTITILIRIQMTKLKKSHKNLTKPISKTIWSQMLTKILRNLNQ